jgi:ankyrin repeat protein
MVIRGPFFSLNRDGLSMLHLAASQGHLEMCKYLVEDLGGDVNAPGVLAGAGGFSLTSFK